jgi:hypothetical protein
MPTSTQAPYQGDHEPMQIGRVIVLGNEKWWASSEPVITPMMLRRVPAMPGQGIFRHRLGRRHRPRAIPCRTYEHEIQPPRPRHRRHGHDNSSTRSTSETGRQHVALQDVLPSESGSSPYCTTSSWFGRLPFRLIDRRDPAYLHIPLLPRTAEQPLGLLGHRRQGGPDAANAMKVLRPERQQPDHNVRDQRPGKHHNRNVRCSHINETGLVHQPLRPGRKDAC